MFNMDILRVIMH